MKYNINVTKSSWRRLRKPSRAALETIYSENAAYTEAFSEAGRCPRRHDPFLTLSITYFTFGGGWDRLFQKQEQVST